MRAEEEKTHLKAIHVDETQLKKDLSELVRGSVEETLNALLDEEADKLYNARKPLTICKKSKVFPKDESLRSIDP
nr:hypothetical protein [Leptospira adleri]